MTYAAAGQQNASMAPPGGPPRPGMVALDVDGTLLDTAHSLSVRNRQSIQALQERGVVVVIASSRSVSGIVSALPGMDHEQIWLCAHQGALVGRTGPADAFTSIVNQTIDGEHVASIFAAADRLDLSVGRYFEDEWAVPKLTPEIEAESRITGIQPVLAETAPGEAHRLQVIASTAHVHRLGELAATLPAGTRGVMSNPTYLEITSASVSKANGLQAVARIENVDPKRTAAVGDGENDADMLTAVTIGFAVGNAVPSLKAVADRMTHDNDHDGVAAAVDMLLAEWGLAQGAATS